MFSGDWDPRSIFSFLNSSVDSSFWRGRRVLDVGSNTGGLSLEIARKGASVIASEPDPYNNTYAKTRDILRDIRANEALDIYFYNFDLRDLINQNRKFDVVLFLGLLYHFRNPQLLLDRLNSLISTGGTLFLSTQTHPGDELLMVNRRQHGVMRENHLSSDINLSGWHITRPLLNKMLIWSGFGDVKFLTDEKFSFPKKPPGLTNSCYLMATKTSELDVELENYKFYPR